MALTAMTIGIAVAATAQKLAAAKVPLAVRNSFAKMYPGSTAKWESEKGAFEAGFKQNGKDLSVLFTKEGTMTESEVDIKVSDLPATVAPFVKSHYKGASIKAAAIITKADGSTTYEAEVNKIDVIFDAQGNFVKEVKD